MALRERLVCVPEVALSNRVPARTQHYAESAASRLRVLKIAAWIGAFVSAAFGIWQLTWDGGWHLGIVNLGTAVIFLLIPLLSRFGELVAPLTFFFVAYVSLSVVCWPSAPGRACSSTSWWRPLWWCWCWASNASCSRRS